MIYLCRGKLHSFTRGKSLFTARNLGEGISNLSPSYPSVNQSINYQPSIFRSINSTTLSTPPSLRFLRHLWESPGGWCMQRSALRPHHNLGATNESRLHKKGRVLHFKQPGCWPGLSISAPNTILSHVHN